MDREKLENIINFVVNDTNAMKIKRGELVSFYLEGNIKIGEIYQVMSSIRHAFDEKYKVNVALILITDANDKLWFVMARDYETLYLRIGDFLSSLERNSK